MLLLGQPFSCVIFSTHTHTAKFTVLQLKVTFPFYLFMNHKLRAKHIVTFSVFSVHPLKNIERTTTNSVSMQKHAYGPNHCHPLLCAAEECFNSAPFGNRFNQSQRTDTVQYICVRHHMNIKKYAQAYRRAACVDGWERDGGKK